MSSLLDNDALERSSVVANSLMNRERRCIGDNSYQKELSFDGLAFLKSRTKRQEDVAWLDLCCGTGKALIEGAQILSAERSANQLTLVGVDLVPMFDSRPSELGFLHLVEGSLASWQPERSFDLITCVHGLHYIGDKLDLIRRAASWLKADGVFLAHLDPANLKFSSGKPAGKRLISDLKDHGFDYRARKHLLVCSGRKAFKLGHEFVGADDGAGPNYTRQAAVDSYYRAGTDDA